MASLYPHFHFVVRENVNITDEARLDFEPSDATVRFGFQNVDEHGAPVDCNQGSIGLFHKQATLGFEYLGFPFTEIFVSPASSAYRLEWSRSWSNWRDHRYTFCGTVPDLLKPRNFTNQPAELRHVVRDFPSVAAPSAGPLFWEYSPWRHSDGYFGVAGFDTTIAPITGPFSYDWWVQLAPYPGHQLLGTGLDLYAWQHGWPTLDQPLFYGAGLRLDHGWPIEGYVGPLYGVPMFKFGGEVMRLGQGPPVWRGQFWNSPTTLQLGEQNTQTMHMTTDMYGSMALGPDPPYTISQNGMTVVSDTLRGAGALQYAPPLFLPLNGGVTTLHTRQPYMMRKHPATLDVTALMDTRASDPDPPSMRVLQLLLGDEATDSIPNPPNARVRFQISDGDSVKRAALSVRNPANWVWQTLPLIQDGDAWSAALPSAWKGLVAMRLTASDPTGNSLTLTWDPAYEAQPAQSLQLAANGARLAGGGVTVSWHAIGAGGAHVSIERREPTTAWALIGAADADPAGFITYADTTVVIGHQYGYRASLETADGVIRSPEQWITVIGQLAIAGARPNPALHDISIAFTLPDAAPARITVLDLAGRVLSAQDVGALGPGPHLVEVRRGAVWRAGLYFVRLTRGSESHTARVVLL
jgi:hypothetical protein